MSALLLACSTLALPAIGSDGTEFLCEEAVAHIASCCPAFEPGSVSCEFGIGCDAPPEAPDFTAAQSHCVEQLSCAELRRAPICQGDGNVDPNHASNANLLTGTSC